MLEEAPKTKLRAVNHIGIPVRDLDRSLEFYTKLTGQEPMFVEPMYGPGLANGANVPDAEVRFAMIQIDNTVLELLEYTQPKGEPFNQNNNDVGSIHIAFTVEDIDAVYADLKSKGVEFNAPPHEFTKADGAPDVIGAKFAYLKDPDGIQLELNQPAGG